MRATVFVLLLLAAAPAALGDTQNVQNTQNTQNAQLFGLPPLPLALAAAGAVLSKVGSPIRLSTRVITDKPAEQAAGAGSGAAAAAAGPSQASYGTQYSQATGPSADGAPAQQQQPPAASNSAVPPGVVSWIQNPDGTITPLKWADGQNGKGSAIQVTTTNGPTVLQGQVVSGTIVAGTVMPIATTMPAQQGSFQNWTAANATYSTPDTMNSTTAGSISQQDTVAAMTPDPTPMVIAMPVSQPMVQQQQQVWMPVSQGPQVVQGYYIPGQSKGAQVVQGYYIQRGSQASYVAGAAAAGPAMPSPAFQPRPQMGWGVRRSAQGQQGQGWGAGGMRPAGPGSGQVGQGWGGMGMGQMSGGGMIGAGPRPAMGPAMGPLMGPGASSVGQVQDSMGAASAPSTAISSTSTTDDNSSSGSSSSGSGSAWSGQQQQAQGAAADDTSSSSSSAPQQQQQPSAVMEPTVIVVDASKPSSSSSSSSSPSATVSRPSTGVQTSPSRGPMAQGAMGSGPGPSFTAGRPTGPAGPRMPMQPGSTAAGPSSAGSGRPMPPPGAMGRRAPGMLPVNEVQGGAGGAADGVMGAQEADAAGN